MPFSRAIRQGIRKHVFPAIETGWAAGFSLVGRMFPPTAGVRRWTARGDEHIAIVAPHPDDETLGAGGVACLHRLAGDHVAVVVVTDGSASRAGGLTPDEMARRRAGEIASASRILGICTLTCLHLPEGQWHEDEARARLAPLLHKAQIVYAPSCVDFHPEHVKVACLVADLLQSDQTVRVYEVGVPLTESLVNLVADIGAVATTKDRALKAFDTQADALAPLARLAGYRARRYRLPAVEVFWEMPARVYTQVMAAGDWRGRTCPYRGIRPRPMHDPLAFLVGRKARAALRT